MVEGVDYFWRTAAYVTNEIFMMYLLERQGLSIKDSGNITSLITMPISLLV